MSLTGKDLLLLLALESNPLIPLKELAKKTQLSWPTVKKRIEELQQRGILRNPFMIYIPEALGLQRVNVFVTLQSFNQLVKLEKACDLHPYTVYRARSFGGKFGLFIQFNIPDGALSRLRKFFQELKKEQIIDNYNLYLSIGIRQEVFPDLTKYDLHTNTWQFSWNQWFNKLIESPPPLPYPLIPETDFSRFKPIHLQILRDFSINAGIKQTEIMKKYNLSKTEAHRLYQFVKKHFVQTVKVNYNRSYFDLSETYLVIIENTELIEQERIYHSLKNNPPPFRLALDILDKDAFLIWGHMSPAQAAQFAFSLWKEFQDTMIFSLNTKDEGAMNYWFYPDNFDFTKKKWKKDEDYMITTPLQALLKA